MIHFNKQEIDKMAKACQYYRCMVSPHSDHLTNDYNKLIDKLKYYEEENCWQNLIFTI